jgi:hypothetical protein
MAYEIRVVDTAGTNLGVLDDATISRFSWELNEPGSAEFSLATTDADAALCLPGREVQIRKDGTLLWWGPIVRPQAGLHESSWQAAGLFWYFTRRFMGRADRINLLTNGDFEAGEGSWTFNNGITHSLDTAIKVEGTQSLELVGTATNWSRSASQTYTHTTQYHPYGDALTASVWVYVDAAAELGGVIEGRGLRVLHRDADGKVVNDPITPIDEDTPRDEWVPIEVLIPAVKEDDTLDVRLYPPNGTAYFDLATLTLMESLAFWPSADVADIIEGIVLYAQDLAPFDYGHGKSDLNIDVSASATGVTVSRVYQFAEHRQVADAIQEFVRQGVVDVDIAITATTRTLTTYAPRKGSSYGTTLELDVNLADFTYSWDGESAAGAVVVLGPGDGPDRPEGGASDPAFLGGLTLEYVESAPDDVTVGELDDRAAESLIVMSDPQILEVTTLPGVGIIGDLEVGDTVPVSIDRGWVQIDAIYRVVRIEVMPKTDQATLTLNVIPA